MKELQDFMEDNTNIEYEKYIVQSLVGNSSWSSLTRKGRLYHVGTVPDKRCATYAADIRMMVHYTEEEGWLPLCVYSRRARAPLSKTLKDTQYSSWDMLGTNLSVKVGENKWFSDAQRLLLMDRKDFNKLGIGIDDLIDGYVQTVLACIAIDKMCQRLVDENGIFLVDMFRALNDDKQLVDEIIITSHDEPPINIYEIDSK